MKTLLSEKMMLYQKQKEDDIVQPFGGFLLHEHAKNAYVSTIKYSLDASSWTTSNTGAPANVEGGCYGDGKFIIQLSGDRSATYSRYSEDGITWKANSIPAGSSPLFMSWIKDRFILCGNVIDGYKNSIHSSFNGLDWTGSLLTVGPNVFISSWMYNPKENRLFLPVNSYNASSNTMYYSDTLGDSFQSKTINANIFSCVYAKDMYWAASGGQATNSVLCKSIDGFTWEATSINMSKIFYVKDMFFSSFSNSPNNYSMYSIDGENWARLNFEDSYCISQIGYDYNNNKFVALVSDLLGWYTRIWQSFDGINWTKTYSSDSMGYLVF